jgi:ribonuclease HI
MNVQKKIFDLFNYNWSITKIDNMEYEAVIFRKPRFKRQDFGFSDGSSKYMNNGQQNAGAFITLNDKEKINCFGFIYLKENNSNKINSVEYIAAKLCSDFVKKEGIIYTDSQSTINTYMKEMVNNKSLPYIEYVKAHSGIPYNIMVDVLSKMATNGIPEFSKEAWQTSIKNRKIITRDLKQLLYIQSPDNNGIKNNQLPDNQLVVTYDQELIIEKNKQNIKEQIAKPIEKKVIKNNLIEDFEHHMEKLIKKKLEQEKQISEHKPTINNPVFELFLKIIDHKVNIHDFHLDTNFNDNYNFFTLKNKNTCLQECECLINVDYQHNSITYYVLNNSQKIHEIGSLCSTVISKNELERNIQNIISYLNQKYKNLNIYQSQALNIDNVYSMKPSERKKHYEIFDKAVVNIVNYVMPHIFTLEDISYNLWMLQNKKNNLEMKTFETHNVLLNYFHNENQNNDKKCYIKHHPEEYLISFTIFNQNGEMDFIGIMPLFPEDNYLETLLIMKNFISEKCCVDEFFYLKNKRASWINKEDVIEQCNFNDKYYLNRNNSKKAEQDICDFISDISYKTSQMIRNMKPKKLIQQHYINRKEKTLQMETQSLNF